MPIIKSTKLVYYITNNQKNIIFHSIFFLSKYKFRIQGVTNKLIPGGPSHTIQNYLLSFSPLKLLQASHSILFPLFNLLSLQFFLLTSFSHVASYLLMTHMPFCRLTNSILIKLVILPSLFRKEPFSQCLKKVLNIEIIMVILSAPA